MQQDEFRAPQGHNPQSCECYACTHGMDAMRKHSQEMMAQFGWYAHYVNDEPACPFGINYHTHGLPQSFDHPDIQVCAPVPQYQLHNVIAPIVEAIKKGRRFEVGKLYTEFLQNDLPVQFIEAVECDRPVLRMIVCDKDGRFDTSPWNTQFTMLNNFAHEYN